MTIAHTGIKTPPALHEAVVAWYEAALAPLGYKKAMSFHDNLVVGFADSSGQVDWWVASAAVAPTGVPPLPREGGGMVERALRGHTAFVAEDRATVDAFYKAALAAGGKCNGAPGLREYSTPTYYAAFALDPAGNNIEAACTAPE